MYTAAILFLYATGMLAYLTMAMQNKSFLVRWKAWRIFGILVWPIVIIIAYISVLYDMSRPKPTARFRF